MLRRSVLIAVFLLSTVATALPAPPAAAAVDPAALIGDLGNQALAVLGPGVPPAQRRAAFRRLFRDEFDVTAIARFTLGPYWRSVDASGRLEYESLLEHYIAGIYAAKLADYSGGRLRVTGSRPEAFGYIVSSEATPPDGGRPIKIDWQLDCDHGSCKIGDVVVDNVSMVTAQRAAFAAVIQRNGGQVRAVFAMLRQQAAEQK